MSHPLATQLRRTCPLPLALVGVGNPLRGDDGFGPAVLAALPPCPGIHPFDAGMAPENWLGPIARARPAAILVLDTAHLDRPPGTLQLLRPDQLEAIGASTHALPLGFFLTMVAERAAAPAHLLAVQPAAMALGAPMTPEVAAAVHRVVDLIAALPCPPIAP